MFDYLIKNATIVDGTGSPAFTASVAVEGDQIVKVIRDGALPEAKTVIDAQGKVLTPGFIDNHSHADICLPFYPHTDSLLMQGITTFVGSNCGMGIAPAHNKEFIDAYMKQIHVEDDVTVTWKTFGEWLDTIRSHPIGANYVPLVGHNALRGSVLGLDNARPSTDEERAKVVDYLNEALDNGAFGMSYSNDPGQVGHFADRTEMQALFKTLEARNSYVTAHTRHHQNQWPSDDGRNYYGVFVGEPGDLICGRYHGLLEFMELFKETPKLTAVYSHLTNGFLAPIPHSQAMEDAMIDETLKVFVDDPVSEGYDVYFNLLTHPNSLSGIRKVLEELIPSMKYDAELKEFADRDSLLRLLPNPDFRKKLMTYIKSGKFKMNMLSPATDPYWPQCFTFFTAKDKSLLNRTLWDIAEERFPGQPRSVFLYETCYQVFFDLLCADPDLEWALTRDKREYQGLNRLIKNPRCMPMTDSPTLPEKSDKWISPMGYGNPPLAYTSFIRFLVDFSKKDNALSREEAIHRMTGLPAKVMRITDRGRIAEGMKADLVLINWEKLGYTIDFNNPSAPPMGIDYVWVNGVPAVKEGILTHALTGKVLTRQ